MPDKKKILDFCWVATAFCPTLKQNIIEANSNIEELVEVVDDQGDKLTSVKNQFDDFEIHMETFEQNMTQINSKIGELEEHDQELRRVFKLMLQGQLQVDSAEKSKIGQQAI